MWCPVGLLKGSEGQEVTGKGQSISAMTYDPPSPRSPPYTLRTSQKPHWAPHVDDPLGTHSLGLGRSGKAEQQALWDALLPHQAGGSRLHTIPLALGPLRGRTLTW